MDPTTALAGSFAKILEVYGAAGAIGIIAGVAGGLTGSHPVTATNLIKALIA